MTGRVPENVERGKGRCQTPTKNLSRKAAFTIFKTATERARTSRPSPALCLRRRRRVPHSDPHPLPPPLSPSACHLVEAHVAHVPHCRCELTLAQHEYFVPPCLATILREPAKDLVFISTPVCRFVQRDRACRHSTYVRAPCPSRSYAHRKVIRAPNFVGSAPCL